MTLSGFLWKNWDNLLLFLVDTKMQPYAYLRRPHLGEEKTII
jgi:hypothetical protein